MNDIPAFPNEFHPSEMGSIGMTLRDYFAAKALQSYWSDPSVASDLITASAWAYDMADAMLKARVAK